MNAVSSQHSISSLICADYGRRAPRVCSLADFEERFVSSGFLGHMIEAYGAPSNPCNPREPFGDDDDNDVSGARLCSNVARKEGF